MPDLGDVLLWGTALTSTLAALGFGARLRALGSHPPAAKGVRPRSGKRPRRTQDAVAPNRSPGGPMAKMARPMAFGAALLGAGTWFLLLSYFARADIGYAYVHTHTSTVTESLAYRIAGTWSGQEGSFLLWLWVMAVAFVLVDLLGQRHLLRLRTQAVAGLSGAPQKLHDAERFWALTCALGATYVALFAAMAILKDPFRPTPAVMLSVAPEGFGLNPLLQTRWMLIHPLVTFSAYGVSSVPFAMAMAGMALGTPLWARTSVAWARLAALLYTAALGLGGLWAYEVLGWGGYWAWDPVETASWLPWLGTVATLHGLLLAQRGRLFPLVPQVLAAMTFCLTLFATFATRLGGIWVFSVHVFDPSTTSDPTLRFIEALTSSAFNVVLLASLVATALAVTLLAGRILRNDVEVPIEPMRRPWAAVLTDRSNLLVLPTTLGGLAALMTFFLLINRTEGIDPDEFDLKLAPFVMLAAIGLTWLHLGWAKDRRLPLLASLAGLGSGIVTLLLLPGRPLLAGVLPVLCVALGAIGWDLGRAMVGRHGARARARLVLVPLIHLGVMLILVGYSTSQWLTYEGQLTLQEGTPATLGSYTFTLERIEQGTDTVQLHIAVTSAGTPVGEASPGSTHFANAIATQNRTELSILTHGIDDIYVVYKSHLQAQGRSMAIIDVKVLPLVTPIWSGMGCILLGIAGRIVLLPARY